MDEKANDVDFIFMLTRQDQTVTDCRRVIERVRQSGVNHIGFKDVGVDPDVLAALHDDIKALGAISYMEIVSTNAVSALSSARLGVDLGVDRLLGGTWVDDVLSVTSGSGTEYYPFPGAPEGHPTVLGGSPEMIADHCRTFEAKGCAGVDLLAYRASAAAPMDLVRAARAATNGRLIVAGSVTSIAQVTELAEVGVDAFTVGSAVFSGEIDPRAALMESQLDVVRQWVGETNAVSNLPGQPTGAR
jgi:methylmalonyl-CoA mutase cobalamin-binding subunit